MTEIKPVSSYEPVYQSLGYHNQWKDINKERYETLPENHRRILYPAAAYEYMKNCADELLAENNKILSENEQIKSNCAKLLSEQDYQYNKQTNELIARHVEQLDVAREFCRQLQMENNQLKADNAQLTNVVGAMDDIITTPDNQIRVMLYDTLLERDELKKQNNCLVRDKDNLVIENNHLQFLLDSVMLEFCPDEMTEEQMENWSKHQKKSNLEIEL